MPANPVYIKHEKQISHFRSRKFKTVVSRIIRGDKIEDQIDQSYFSGKITVTEWDRLICLLNKIQKE